ncbi:MAG: FMN-binding protein [Parcubacteria group bacterium]|jgi:uncharacterized protein with FMN-binding domain
MTKTIKKFLLSAFVIISSVFYVLFQRVGNGPNFSNNTGAGLATRNSISQNSSPMVSANANYKDGQYTGTSADAYYGNIQVKAVIQNGKITDVQFLDYPQDRRTSISINTNAMPILKQEAIQAQSANVDIVTGATDTSQAFQESLTSALNRAV